MSKPDSALRGAGVAVLIAILIAAVAFSGQVRDALIPGAPERLSTLHLDDAYLQQSSPPSCFAALFAASPTLLDDCPAGAAPESG